MYPIESTAHPSILADADDVIFVSRTSDNVHGKMATSLKTVFILYMSSIELILQ